MAENCHEKRQLAPMRDRRGFYMLTRLHLQKMDEWSTAQVFETWAHGKGQSRPGAGREIGVLERRGKPRVSEPFPTTVFGIDKAGESFKLDCTLDNISSTGLYLKIPRQLEQGSEVRLIVSFSAGPSPGAGAAIRGVALRSDPQTDKRWGLAVAITDHTFNWVQWPALRVFQCI